MLWLTRLIFTVLLFLKVFFFFFRCILHLGRRVSVQQNHLVGGQSINPASGATSWCLKGSYRWRAAKTSRQPHWTSAWRPAASPCRRPAPPCQMARCQPHFTWVRRPASCSYDTFYHWCNKKIIICMCSTSFGLFLLNACNIVLLATEFCALWYFINF